MKCRACGRWMRRPKVGRSPDGRLRFDVCFNCLFQEHRHALGLDRDFKTEQEPKDGFREFGRTGILRLIALLLTIWGLLLVILGASSRLGWIPDPQGFGPANLDRLGVFAVAGGIVAIFGVALALFTIEDRILKRRFARSIEWLSLAVGLGLLIFGILTHHPKRDPWIVAGVASVFGLSWMARFWAAR